MKSETLRIKEETPSVKEPIICAKGEIKLKITVSAPPIKTKEISGTISRFANKPIQE